MRTIIFRGKRIDNGKWVYGYVDATMYKDIVVIHTETGTFGVDPDTIGQFTGLYDKNGKEIYEDDVLLSRHNRRYVVCWNEEELRYILVNILNADNHLNMYKDCMDDFEVIGNIHDNKELLTQN